MNIEDLCKEIKKISTKKSTYYKKDKKKGTRARINLFLGETEYKVIIIDKTSIILAICPEFGGSISITSKPIKNPKLILELVQLLKRIEDDK